MQNKVIKCEVWTRTVGYFRNVESMHAAKQEEIRQRKLYDANGHTEDYA